jgi:hypothetical protein
MPNKDILLSLAPIAMEIHEVRMYCNEKWETNVANSNTSDAPKNYANTSNNPSGIST